MVASASVATNRMAQAAGRAAIPVRPGRQAITLAWRESSGITTVLHTPAIAISVPSETDPRKLVPLASVNVRVTVDVPSDRWLLLTGGIHVGPAVLFWSMLLGLLLVVETVFSAIPATFFRKISPFLPSTAGQQIVASQSSIDQTRAAVGTARVVLDPWQGYGVMMLWVVVLLAVAAVLLRRRDA